MDEEGLPGKGAVGFPRLPFLKAQPLCRRQDVPGLKPMIKGLVSHLDEAQPDV